MFTPSVHAAPVIAGHGFLDIPWGSLPDEIQEKLGAATERDEETCNDESAANELAREGEDCLFLRVDPYFVNGIDFAVTFRFDAGSQGLRMVTLRSTLKSKNLDPRFVKKMLSECRQNFERISRGITSEFGAPLPPRDLSGQPESKFTKAEFGAWARGETGVWLRRSYGYNDHWKRWRKADGCEIELRYFSTPAPITETGN
jgi:hypothetical protein